MIEQIPGCEMNWKPAKCDTCGVEVGRNHFAVSVRRLQIRHTTDNGNFCSMCCPVHRGQQPPPEGIPVAA